MPETLSTRFAAKKQPFTLNHRLNGMSIKKTGKE
jgi:hypothetical protein